jgi:hypothetical protein
LTGPLGLHGGGEFLKGDEPFLGALLEAAQAAGRPTRIELVTTAIARHRPELAFGLGSATIGRVADGAGIDLEIRHARVVDASSAADPEIAARLEAADLVYLPGGDPDAVLAILRDTAALAAIERVRQRGAVVAGASAGAMALGEITWTREGYWPGFGWAGRLLVVPHVNERRMAGTREHVDRLAGEPELAILGLPEQGGVIGRPGEWRVISARGAWWWPAGTATIQHFEDGAAIRG